jgi:hypothetical protein
MGIFGRRSRGVGVGGVDGDDDERGGGTCDPSEGGAAAAEGSDADSMVVVGCSSGT